MYLWNTDEGGPCVLRPTSQGAFDNPAAGTMSGNLNYTANLYSQTAVELQLKTCSLSKSAVL